MPNINELTLAKELIKFPSITPVDAGAINFLDSPSTTSSTTYKIQGKCQSGATGVINRSGGDANADYGMRTASSITVMELSG